jgi:hypothetical protein
MLPANKVDLPEPVGPVITINPCFGLKLSQISGSNSSWANGGGLDTIVRIVI